MKNKGECENGILFYRKQFIHSKTNRVRTSEYSAGHGGAAELAKKYCEACGVHVNYINVIVMVDNWLPSFDMNEQKKN